VSLPTNWSWLLTAEVSIVVVLVRRLLDRFSIFQSKRTDASGWRRAAEAVIAVTSIGLWVAGWSRPPKESLSVLAGLALGCVIDELVQARAGSADQLKKIDCDAGRDSALIAPSDSKFFRHFRFPHTLHRWSPTLLCGEQRTSQTDWLS
jgi:hypothetical protein